MKILANATQSSGQVGWLGNFTDMALKTCLRNLLSKWGYLSVEMQGVLADDTDDAQEARDNAIAETRTKTVNIEDVNFEEQKSETPEQGPNY